LVKAVLASAAQLYCLHQLAAVHGSMQKNKRGGKVATLQRSSSAASEAQACVS